ncbi:hypothetical protein [Yersinia enterocolitica]|uniref:hypothetical protein n=1 Tax=Yersinia enterocolitica TaxID=630 RepID=UPI001C6101B7|nr:hypothetical protein [Yersinia enterocolitica]EKN4770205.1 hypothetical protein [Yersinia enterocolitica]EKN5956406.1 hypothetical protein [Yersinia enterocolitica]MBW5840000.1 hypothetical protein [Yersinia enterocolitica]MBW5848624.1 hypothetical protein [Yersinia enterocolitica]MBW5853069.1 hypothetical protein [Yersinia enterocolitica]
MMLKSEIKQDVGNLINYLRHHDYEIPSIGTMFSLSIRRLQVFYLLLGVGGLFSWLYHGPHEFWSACVIFLFCIVGAGIISAMLIGVLYYPSAFLLCISNDVKKKSPLCCKWDEVINSTSIYVNTLCALISIPFVFIVNWGFLVPLGAYFVAILIASSFVKVIMVRYLTPELVDFLKNIRDMRLGQ